MSGAGRWSGPLLAGVLAALAILCAARGAAPTSAAAVLLVFGAGYPWLVRWSPVEPSPLKVALYAGLLSPLVVGLALFLFELALPTAQAWRATWGVVAASQLLALGRRPCKFEPLGKAAWASVALALALGGTVAWLLFGGQNAPRLVHDGALFQAGVAQAMERGLPWENPWFAGAPLPVVPAHPFLVRVVSEALGTTTPGALALLACVAPVATCVALYLLAAPLYREPKRVVLAAPIALLAVNALGGLLPLRGEPGETWAGDLARLGLGQTSGGVLYGLAAFVRPGSAAIGTAYAVATLSAAAHGLRHGRRPWVGLTVLLALATTLVHPWLGFATAGAVLAVALAHPGAPGVRGRLVTALAFAALPALFVLRTFGLEVAPSAAPAAPFMPTAVSALGLQAVLALGLVGGRWLGAGGPGDERGRATILALVVAAGAAALAFAVVAGPGRADLVHLAALVAGVLAAGGAVDALGRGGGPRLAAGAVGLALVLGAARADAHALGVHRELSTRRERTLEEGRRIVPQFVEAARTFGDGLLPGNVVATPAQARDAAEVRRRHLALAYRWLREELPREGARPILVRAPAEADPAAVDPDPAALYAHLPLWVDREALAFGAPRWEIRHERMRRLYSDPQYFEPAFMKEFEALARPVVFLVEERDRERTVPRGAWRPFRGIDVRLERHGAQRVHVEGTVALYLWRPSTAGIDR